MSHIPLFYYFDAQRLIPSLQVIGPFLIAPLSELYGRFYIYHTGNILFVLFTVGAALSTNIQMLIAFRFLNGLAVTAIILNPSIVGDIYAVERRGAGMALTGMMPLIGPVIAPIAGSYVGQAAGWRWVFWLVAIICGTSELFFILFFRETYKVRILRQKAKKLREKTGNPNFKSKYDTESASKAFREAILRPMKMLLFSPMLVILSLYVAVVYSYMYLIITTLTEVFEDNYGFSEGAAGLAFLGFSKLLSLRLATWANTSQLLASASVFLCVISRLIYGLLDMLQRAARNQNIGSLRSHLVEF
jgi:MFS family permease